MDFAEAFGKIRDNTLKFKDKINSDEFQDKFKSPFDENGHYVGSKSKQKKESSSSESRQVTGPHRDMSDHSGDSKSKSDSKSGSKSDSKSEEKKDPKPQPSPEPKPSEEPKQPDLQDRGFPGTRHDQVPVEPETPNLSDRGFPSTVNDQVQNDALLNGMGAANGNATSMGSPVGPQPDLQDRGFPGTRNDQDLQALDLSDRGFPSTVNDSVNNGAKQIGNTNKDVANAKPGDWLVRSNGQKIELTQAHIDWARKKLGMAPLAGAPVNNVSPDQAKLNGMSAANGTATSTGSPAVNQALLNGMSAAKGNATSMGSQ